MSDILSTKGAVSVAIGTVLTSLGSLLNAIPGDIGKIGVILGSVLTLILIQKARQDKYNSNEQSKIDMAIKREQLQALVDTREHHRRSQDKSEDVK